MNDELVQISKRSGRIDRVPSSDTPFIEIYLAPGQYVSNVALEPIEMFHSSRKTRDWRWTAYIVTPLGSPDA